MRGFLLTTLLLAGLWAEPALALKGQPKLGPEAVPITQQTEYLRTAPAPDYWKLSPFYVPQQTSSACSLASVVMALNALRGLPARSDQRLITQSALLKKVAQAAWVKQVAEGGSGVTFDGLGVVIAVVGMTASGAFLWLAQRDIPLGTAYAVWTGIGAAGTCIVGILFYGDAASAWRLASVGLIVAGIIGLKLAHGSG